MPYPARVVKTILPVAYTFVKFSCPPDPSQCFYPDYYHSQPSFQRLKEKGDFLVPKSSPRRHIDKAGKDNGNQFIKQYQRVEIKVRWKSYFSSILIASVAIIVRNFQYVKMILALHSVQVHRAVLQSRGFGY